MSDRHFEGHGVTDGEGLDAIKADTVAEPSGTPRPPQPTKKAQLIRLLRRKAGADLQTLSTRLGWQPHTTRAAVSRLRKAGHVLTAERPADGRPLRYRIVQSPED